MKIKIFKKIANLNFAIILLFIITFVILIGSIIEQDKPIDFYQQNYPEKDLILGFLNWKLIQILGLDHFYRTYWFITLLIVFGLSLLICTFLQQFPIVKFSRVCNFNKSSFVNLEISFEYSYLGKFTNRLLKAGYIIYQQKTNLYSLKGLIGRVSPIFVHISILLILFGSIFSSLCGFNVQELVPQSEIFHIQNTIVSGVLSKFSQQPIRLNDFWINYYENNKIKQFYSNISILNENGDELINETISVNQPLIYNNLTFYQTDWTVIGLRVKQKTNYFQLPFILFENLNNKSFLSWLPTQIKDSFKDLNQNSFSIKTLLIDNYKENILIYNLNGNIETKVNMNEFVNAKNYKIVELLVSSGFQIKYDPGIFIIYFGFAFLMLSTFLSYISFSQIWVNINKFKTPNKLLIFAKTNRDPTLLNIEVIKMTKNDK